MRCVLPPGALSIACEAGFQDSGGTICNALQQDCVYLEFFS